MGDMEGTGGNATVQDLLIESSLASSQESLPGLVFAYRQLIIYTIELF